LKKILLCIVTLILIIVLSCISVCADENLIKGSFAENVAPVRNPGKGLVYTLWNPDELDIATEDLKYFSDVYIRWNWNIIEPEEDVYKWEVIDKYVDFCKEHSLKLFFGIMNQNVINGYSTPKWVFDAGAKSVPCYCGMSDILAAQSAVTYVPVWDDPVFLEKYNNFVNAVGERYANHPNVKGIALLGYGTYGEGVVGSRMSPVNSADTIPSLTTDKQWELIHKPWMDNFADKEIIFECVDGHERAIEEGVNIIKKNTLIGGNYDEGYFLQSIADDRVEVMHEFYTAYGYDTMKIEKIRPAWEPAYFLDEIVKGRSSYVLFALANNWFGDNRDLFRLISNRIGYHFVLREGELTERISNGSQMDIKLKFENVGISRLHNLCTLKLAVLDKNGNPVQTKIVSNADPGTWFEGKTYDVEDTITLDSLDEGSYRLAVGFMKKSTDIVPTYEIGNYNNINGWYAIASLECDGDDTYVTKMLTDPYADVLDSSYVEDSITYVPFDTAFCYGTVAEENISYTISGNVGANNADKDISLLIKNKLGFPIFVNQLTVDSDGGFSFSADINGNIYDNNIVVNCAGSVYAEPHIVISEGDKSYEIKKLDGKYYIPAELFGILTGVELELGSDGTPIVESIQLGDDVPYEQIAGGIADVSADSPYWSGDADFEVNGNVLTASNTENDTTFERYVGIDYDKWYKVSFKSKGEGKVRLRIYDSWNSPITAVCTEPSAEDSDNHLYFKIPSYFYGDVRTPYVRFVFESTGQGGSTEITELIVTDDQLAIFAEMNKNGFELTVNSSVENDAFGFTRRYDGRADYTEDYSYSGAGSIRFDQNGPEWSSVAQLFSDKMRKTRNGTYSIEGQFMLQSKDQANPVDDPFAWMSVSVINNGENVVLKNYSNATISLKENVWRKVNKSFEITTMPTEGELCYDYLALWGLTTATEKDKRNHYIYIDDLKITKKHTDDIHIYGMTAHADEFGANIGVSGLVETATGNEPVIIVAVYDSKGSLKAAKSTPMGAGSTHTITAETSMENGDELKVYFWHLKTLEPFEKPEIFKMENGKLVHQTVYNNDFDVVVIK